MFVRFCGMNIPFWFQLEVGERDNPITGHWQLFFDAVRLKYNLSKDSYEIVIPDVTAFGEVTDSQNGTGMIGHFLRNECDLALVPISPTVENFPYVDFTIPAAISEWKIVTAITNGKSHQFTYDIISIYENEVWYVLITCVFLFPLLICLRFKNKAKAYGESLFRVYTYLVQQDYVKKIVDGSRILWICWFIAAFCLTWIFKSCLLSKTTLPEPWMKIDYLADILGYPNLQLVLMKDTTPVSLIRDSKDPIMRRVWDQILRHDGVKTPDDIVINLEENLEKAGLGKMAILTSADMFFQACYNFEIEQKYIDRLRLGPETVVVDLFSFCIRRGFSPELSNVIKDLTHRFAEQCLMDRTVLFELWKGYRLFQKHSHDEPKRLSTANLYFITMVGSVGLFVSICVFTWEMSLSI